MTTAPTSGPSRLVIDPLHRLHAWVQGLQTRDLTMEPGRGRRFVLKIARVLLLVVRFDVVGRLRLNAQALTYDTLLALVPLFAVMFAAVSGFGGLEDVRARLEALVLSNLSGTEEVRAAVAEHLHRFLGNIRTGTFSAVSVVILIYSVLSLLGHIESAINAVFGVQTSRPWLSRLMTYWAALTLGPLLLGASLALTAAFQTTRAASFLETLGLGAVLLKLLPLVVTIVAFTAMYLVIPATHVRPSAAVFAAVVAGSLWNLAKFLYADYARGALTVQNIYGSLAAVPLFILWIYLSWLLVLLGAQLAFAYQTASTYHNETLALRANQRYRERVACRAFLEIARDFYAGRGPTDADALAEGLGIPRRLLESVASDLKAGGFVREVEAPGLLVPARDLAQVTVADVLSLLRSGLGVQLALRGDDGGGAVEGILDELERELLRVGGNTSFRDLAATPRTGAAPAKPSAGEHRPDVH